jgi:hypothetical protein
VNGLLGVLYGELARLDEKGLGIDWNQVILRNPGLDRLYPQGFKTVRVRVASY